MRYTVQVWACRVRGPGAKVKAGSGFGRPLRKPCMKRAYNIYAPCCSAIVLVLVVVRGNSMLHKQQCLDFSSRTFADLSH